MRNPIREAREREARLVELEAIAQENEIIKERIAELENELVGWRALSSLMNNDFSRDALRTICELSFMYFLKNPLIKRAVLIQTSYVFGGGLSIKAENDEVNAVIQDFLDKNKKEIWTQQALEEKENELQLNGNLFFAFFPGTKGELKVRMIPFEEIDAKIVNPEDSRDVWYYVRTYIAGNQTKTVLYPDWQHTQPADRESQVITDAGYGDKEIMKDVYVYHVAVNKIGRMHFGVSEVYAALDWARAYKEFLENWTMLVKSYARLAWTLTANKKKDSQAASLKVRALSQGQQQVGDIAVMTAGYKLEPIKTGGATVAVDDSRRLLLMVCSAVGIYEHYFGDPSCYSEDTEVLTEKGWILHKDWKRGNKIATFNPKTEKIEFIEPKELRVFDYIGEMIAFKNRQTDILVTPNHRMWTSAYSQWKRTTSNNKRGKLNREFRFVEASEILKSKRTHGWEFKNSAEFTNEKIRKISNEYARFIGYFVSEGSLVKSARGSFRINLHQKDEIVLKDMRETIKNLGYKWHENKNQCGCITLIICSEKLYKKIEKECGKGSYNKKLPKDFLIWNLEARQILFKALMDGDGGRSGRSLRYSTVSKKLADDMSLLAMSLGYGANIVYEFRKYNGKPANIYRVWIRRKWKNPKLLPRQIKKINYSGKVYCFHIPPYHIYLTRRNGKIAIQGNTGNLATATSMERPMELKFQSRQSLWTDIFQDILQYKIDIAIKYGQLPGDSATGEIGKNEKGEPLSRLINIRFPDITQHSIKERVDAVVSATTLNGQAPAGTLNLKLTTRMLLEALEQDNIDETMDILFPPENDGKLPNGQDMPTDEEEALKIVKQLNHEIREKLEELKNAEGNI